ncbi:MAG: hypothetical protein DDT30_01205 [Dehalococcoidia bacterium]|nr:hypothetical protein [Bacillota bacterium]
MSDTTVQTFAGGLYGGAITHFGSWRAAVEAAGLEYGTIRRSQRWNKEEIHNAVQCAVTADQRLVRTSFPPNFYPAVLDHFGSWEKLLEESGYGEKPWGKIDERLQNHICEFRKKAGLSQTELGKRIGVSHRTISLLELSQQIDPRVSFAIRLAKELGCNVSDLFSHSEH